MAFTSGTRLGPYEIIARIGAGGMGEVYRATDTNLKRDVAIKVLPEAVSGDAERLARFQREAEVLAALNHTNIAAIYGLERADGQTGLVMELVQGPTLAERVAHGPLPLEEAVAIAAQIAEGLEAAHEQNIVHRDLKPANIKVRNDGTVKVLDFGLARTLGQGSGPGEPAAAANATTVTSPVGVTRAGAVLGTIAYMSPEQARGSPVDKRTDIWSFGCVLYELLTGRMAFPGATVSDTIVSILERDPDWTALPGSTPATVRHLLARCLEKHRNDRLRDIGDARIELREALAQARPKGLERTRRGKMPWPWIWTAVGVAAAALLIAYALQVRPPAPPGPQVRLNLVFEGLRGEAGTPVPSPDGTNFVFQAFDASGRRFLWLRRLDSESARPLPGTDDAEQPFWFPDGLRIGFFAQGKLRRINLSGGTPQIIADVPTTAGGFASSAAANDSGDIIFAPVNRSPLFRVRSSDGSIVQLTRLDSTREENSHRFPIFLRDGRRFLFVARSGRRENNALYLGSLDSSETRRIMAVHSNVIYMPPRTGRPATLLYARDGTLVEHRFDGENVVGEPNEIVENVEYTAPSLLARFAASSDATVLIFRPAGSGRKQLRWFDRNGRALGTLGPPGESIQPRISPDGSRVLVSRPDAQTGTRDVWYVETSRGVDGRLTTHAANDWWPVWGPDSQSLLFGSDRDGGSQQVAYRKTSMEAGNGERRLFGADAGLPQLVPEDWSRDGNWVSFSPSGATADDDLWVLPTSAGKPFAFLTTPFAENSSRFSPDHRWIAYTSNESGRYEVYVRPFAGAPAGPGGKIQVSTAGGDFAVWRRDGSELFFIGGNLRLYSVQTSDLGRSAATPQPQALFTPCPETVVAGLPMRSTPWDHPYDVSPDGQQFLINCLALSPGRFDVMLNWSRAFR